ncbi:hypothetical protein BC938DRAFT_474505 [Jimgerdemannia flammicorona]|uniref:FAD dependent oxidoreductase domain-containing protein n=1 Tax=Jimgerdemannia flammicorona TaxID=994334 RepID=A0A433QSG8_9FUNG|nr:hypothetical protein BC938DRAFT_474505 [Jimgerdemannia flammicorona]
MSGLLNFGNPDYKDGPEGNLTDPIPILKKLGVPFTLYENGADIEKDYPCFKNLPANYKAIYSPWNGTINVTLALRTLYELGVNTKNADYIEEEKVVKIQPQGHSRVLVVTEHVGDAGHVTENHYRYGNALWFLLTHADTHSAGKVIVASGAYVNHVTRSLGFEINLQIWEMVFMYFSMKPSFNYPCMWFQFENPDDENQSRLFYGFPAIPGSPPNCARIAVDWAARIIADPVYRRMDVSELEPDMTHRFVAKHCNDVLSQPQFQGTCLMPNVPDNGFVLDFSPESFVGEHHKNIIIFTAGWAFKFIPLFGHILADLALDGSTSYNIRSMCIDRQNVLKPVAAVPDVGSHLPMKGPYFE